MGEIRWDPADAWKMIMDYYRADDPTEEEKQAFVEAADYLIQVEPDHQDIPAVLVNLGTFYCDTEEYSLARKYLERAYATGDSVAALELGCFWYNGYLGEPDYEKAYDCFCQAGALAWAKYELSLMYKKGFYVKKSAEEYQRLIQEVYESVGEIHSANTPLAEVYLCMAESCSQEGKIADALFLYHSAKDLLSKRLKRKRTHDNFSSMKSVEEGLFALREQDERTLDLYDCYFLLAKPSTVVFQYDGMAYDVFAVEENGDCSICFERKWYRSVEDFLRKGRIQGNLLTVLYDQLHAFGRIEA